MGSLRSIPERGSAEPVSPSCLNGKLLSRQGFFFELRHIAHDDATPWGAGGLSWWEL
jgi:hypothetical protein